MPALIEPSEEYRVLGLSRVAEHQLMRYSQLLVNRVLLQGSVCSLGKASVGLSGSAAVSALAFKPRT